MGIHPQHNPGIHPQHNPNLKLVLKVWIPVAFFDEAGYEDDPGKFFFSIFSNTGHQLAMPF
jgi:hypothetical protein